MDLMDARLILHEQVPYLRAVSGKLPKVGAPEVTHVGDFAFLDFIDEANHTPEGGPIIHRFGPFPTLELVMSPRALTRILREAEREIFAPYN